MDDRLLCITIDPAPLADLVRSLVAKAIFDLGTQQQCLPEKLAFTEAEAARLLSLNQHQLRDERRRGRIGASEIVGRRIRYSREDLLQYLARNRQEGGSSR
jgi:hypothetical protein